MHWKDFDKENIFDTPFKIDTNLERKVFMLKDILEEKYRCELELIIIQGARTDQLNIEYYQRKYGETWNKYYNKNSLHVVKEATGMILRAVDIAFEMSDGSRIPGQEIYRAIQENYLFGNVGIADKYVHVDTLIRVWKYLV